ncbi:MAG: OmpA family protein [Alphaproteobacteria bacterium]|nr:OmpA family protein [Alphaproteobacteria bacterium]
MQKLLRWAGKWWLGMIPLAVMWGIAVNSGTDPVRTELLARASAALKGLPLDSADPASPCHDSLIAVDGRDAVLCARAFSEDGRRATVAAVAAVGGVRKVIDETALVAEERPFVWSVERNVVRVKLSGSAPLPAVQAALVETAHKYLGKVDVEDSMKFARGAPPHFEAAATLLVEQIARLQSGSIRISDGSVSLSGMARELGDREAVAGALTTLPEGFTVAANDIKAPPYVFQAYKDPVAGTVSLNGYVPDDNVHARIATAAAFKFFDEKVNDNLKRSAGAPGSFGNAVVAALGALSRLSTGTLEISDNEVQLKGAALYDNAAEDIRVGLGREFPEGWHYKAEIWLKPVPAQYVDGPVCQQLFSDLAAKGRIRFEYAGAEINRDSLGMLDRVVETAMRCPSVNVDVIGYDDGDGDASANQALSQKRAQAVVGFLVGAGLAESRFTALAAAPPAPSKEGEDRKPGRRIEFVVRSPAPAVKGDVSNEVNVPAP